MTFPVATENTFASETAADVIAAHIDKIRDGRDRKVDALVPLLATNHPAYQNRSASEVQRIKAYVMASFAGTGVPGAAIPYIKESLESSFHPLTIAAAAIRNAGPTSLKTIS